MKVQVKRTVEKCEENSGWKHEGVVKRTVNKHEHMNNEVVRTVKRTMKKTVKIQVT